MSMGWRFRAARSALFAVVCVAVAACGHVLMSGESLPWWALVLCTAGVGAPAWLVAGRERGQVTVVALTVAAQAALHGTFTLIQTARESRPGLDGGSALAARWANALLCGPHQDARAAARAYDVAEQAGLTDSMPLPPLEGGSSAIAALGHASHSAQAVQPAHDMGAMTGTASWGMLAAHAIAALLCGLWLARGERAAFQILGALADRVRVPLALLRVVRPLPSVPPAPPVDRSGGRPRRRFLVHTLVTRGPPWETAVS
ncbi:hypothetical protein EES43_02885 [Streptomyces sp. ADI96-02]|uniref:hypothetical protein n=1 Tax=unclassified Streptomyces TaxID=2593676 RepID=UPI000F54E4D2|nr:hypothetical protein [Streptomyces sp. ADI96-02]RPK67733.1 hypothetical protein EES43_02885 [Streptomyces sp. ADI96-02]